MSQTTAALVLTNTQQQRLTNWARAATTPQRLARRARIILGTAAGLGSRRLAQQERMSRTTVQRWRARFLVAGCDGLQDRPRRGRPPVLPPMSRALVVALACERPANRGVPLSRYSLSDLAAEVATEVGDDDAPSRSSIWRWLMQDALRPWRHDCWIFPRDPQFLERAGPVLDLYACRWQGRPEPEPSRLVLKEQSGRGWLLPARLAPSVRLRALPSPLESTPSRRSNFS